MDKQSREQWTSISHEHAQDCLDRIGKGDPDACYELAQIFMSRVPQKDIEVILVVIEALIRQSVASGSKDAEQFLANGWSDMRDTLERRLKKVFG